MSNTTTPQQPITCNGCTREIAIDAPFCTACKSPMCPKCQTEHKDEFGLVTKGEIICHDCYFRRFQDWESLKYGVYDEEK